MNDQFEIKRAIRCGVIPIIGVNGKSSSGKTKSALLLARGIVGPAGKVCGIDTENGRMQHFADDPAIGGFDVVDFQPPFSAARYYEAVKTVIAAGYKACIIDSMSHEWTGEGGSLEFQAEWMRGKTDAMKMLSWNAVAQARAPLLSLILRCPIPLILCFRVKDKVIMPKQDDKPLQPGERRPKAQVTFEEDAPISRKDLVYELTWVAHCEARDGEGGGFFRLQKPGPDTLCREVDAVKSDRITVEHGAAIARWCVGTAAPSNVQTTARKQKSPLEEAKGRLWKLLLTLDPQGTPETAAIWLQGQHIIETGQTLSTLTIEQITAATDKVEAFIETQKA